MTLKNNSLECQKYSLYNNPKITLWKKLAELACDFQNLFS